MTRLLAKDSPTPADVHVPSTAIESGPTRGRKRKRQPLVPPMLTDETLVAKADRVVRAVRVARLVWAVTRCRDAESA